MNRSEFLDLLTMLLRDRQITLEESRQALAVFDAGNLNPNDLPLPVAEALREDDDDLLAALLLLLALFGPRYDQQFRFGTGPRIGAGKRNQVRDQVRQQFEQDIQNLAPTAATVRTWHTNMSRAVAQYILAQHMAGLGRRMNPTEQAAVNQAIREQRAFLYRFAGHIATRQAVGNPLSPEYVANRATNYGGAGWAAYWQGRETADTSEGDYLVHYIDRDDRRVCPRCREAGRNSPYRSGTDYPRPGQICLAGGRCRCELRFERVSARRAA